ncbi:MAG: peptidoglycan DD-metalloendopeptidase family protein, partial [candidate division Zixibacteria bacterium]|nr:peptidoglycan DD-metalloendopeptidase family protein [Gammaproteobacteria bacterium]NIX55751.1 peptidoglycan DD-metalloendopeptidase family protein [candidate division Zixibacteria bacterium]
PKPDLDTDYPLAWPISGRITQGYQDDHPALDIGAPYSSKVYAAGAGTVIYTRWARTGYGFTVIIDHSNNLKTIYSHLKGSLVESGTYVTRGQTIGEVGSTGNSTGPHVHFEVLEDGEQVNPLNYLR